MNDQTTALIVGAGPAGCAAACALVDAGISVVVLDKLDQPGGLARSINRDGNIFDIGPHRFFTKSDEVLDLWRNYLREDLISVNRLTRILYKGKLFNYPLSPMNALMGLGIGTAAHAFAGYGLTKLKRLAFPRTPESFEDWVSDNFGMVLYEAFFKHYTEKVWGIPCSEISADWASQRIKGLNLFKAVYNAFTSHRSSQIKTLVDRFVYPINGAGWLYTKMMDHAVANGAKFIPGATANEVRRTDSGWEVRYSSGDSDHTVTATHVISSAPITELLRMLRPQPPDELLEAASALRFRNHYCVNLVVRDKVNLFPDNWIYVHSPEVKMGRIANYANFSNHLQKSPENFPVTVEYFSFPGDDVSVLNDSQRVELAIRELTGVRLLKSHQKIVDAFVVFSPAAYPVIKIGYERHLGLVRNYLRGLTGFQTIGRAGLFQYNNQDHSIMTGLLAARNVLGADYDVWTVNVDAEYHESGTAPDLCETDRSEFPGTGAKA
jgi:protoporphyrinogen oxidase